MPTAGSPYRQLAPTPSGALASLAAGSSGDVEEKVHGTRPRALDRRMSSQFEKPVSFLSKDGLLVSGAWDRSARLPDPKRVSFSQEPGVQRLVPVRGNFSGPRLDAVWLADTLDELGKIDQLAASEDLPQPSAIAKQNAIRIINALANGPYPEPAIYPTQDGEIAILFQKRDIRAAVLILCDADGGGACFSTFSDQRLRARYEDASDLPDTFMKSQVLRLRVS